MDLGDPLRQCERREQSSLPHVSAILNGLFALGSPNSNRSAWARDETPSPTEEDPEAPNSSSLADPSASYFPAQLPAWDAASTDTNATERGQSRWWVFTRPRRQQSTEPANGIPMAELSGGARQSSTDTKGKAPEDGHRPMGQRLRSTVLMAADSAERWRQRRRPTAPAPRSNSGHQTSDDGDTIIAAHRAELSEGTMSSTLASSSRIKPTGTKGELRLDIPAVPKDAYTVPYNDTPGWQSPWAPYRARQRPANLHQLSRGVDEVERHYTPSETESEKRLGSWGKRRRKLRRCILYNDFTPLVSEFGDPHLKVPCVQ